MELLDLNGCTTNKMVTEKIKSRVRSVNLDKLIKDLSVDFIFHEDATKKIYTALSTGKNSILFGPGGFGKSVLVKAICSKLGLPVVYKVGYENMSPEELLGIPNMNKLMNDSIYETAFENSVFSKPAILVLEEFFDASPSTAAALKDILTEKGLREGDVKKESLISSVIITGNKSPDEVSINDSTKAFYKERFPIRHHMVWPDFSESNYLNFFKVYFKDLYNQNFQKFLLLSKLCHNTSTIVSPRIAAAAGDIILDLGIDYIDSIEDIDTSSISIFKKEVEEEKKVYEEQHIISNATDFIKKLNILSDDPVTVINNYCKLVLLEERLKLYSFSEYNIEESIQLFSNIKQLKELIFKPFMDNSLLLENIDELIQYDNEKSNQKSP